MPTTRPTRTRRPCWRWPTRASTVSSCASALDLPIREFRLRFQQGQVNLTALRFEHGVGPTDARLLLLNDLEHVRPADAVPWE